MMLISGRVSEGGYLVTGWSYWRRALLPLAVLIGSQWNFLIIGLSHWRQILPILAAVR